MPRENNALKHIKVIIFDLDGTLVDAYRAIESSFNFTMRKLRLPVKGAAIIRKAVGWGDKMLLAPFVPECLLTRALKTYREHHTKALAAGSKVFPSAKRLLRKLKLRYALAVASNRPTFFSGILLRGLGLKKYFDFVVCADRLKRGKPHPLILKKILLHFRLKASQALYVGDMAIDAQTGKRAQVKTVIVRTGSSSLRQIRQERPYRIISRIGELGKILITTDPSLKRA